MSSTMSRPNEVPQARTPQRRNGKLRVTASLRWQGIAAAAGEPQPCRSSAAPPRQMTVNDLRLRLAEKLVDRFIERDRVDGLGKQVAVMQTLPLPVRVV